jgi:hypothetical protein
VVSGSGARLSPWKPPYVERITGPRLLQVLVFVSCLLGCLPSLREAHGRIALLWNTRAESILGARSRIYGTEYSARIQEIKELIPPTEDYFLAYVVNGDGADYWVRYDLAPRRVRLLGTIEGNIRLLSPGVRAEWPRYVIVAAPWNRPPNVFLSVDYLSAETTFLEGTEDNSIPASIDVPADGATANTRVTVQGWCQERGGHPCSNIQILLDGLPIASNRIERFPRRDVEAAVPGIGDCSLAGYRVTIELALPDPSRHALVVIFQTSDNRYRVLGPRVFGATR